MDMRTRRETEIEITRGIPLKDFDVIMLSQLKPSEQGVVVAVQGGRGLRQKLSLRGISEGSVVRMIWASRGPIVVDVDRSTVCMGRGMAQRVRIRRI
jgi:Fe2+ transport system protein FeoA